MMDCLVVLWWVTIAPLMMVDLINSFKRMNKAKTKAKFWNAL